MKVLWIINAPTPRAARALGIPRSGFPTWIEAAHEAILGHRDIEVMIAFPLPGAGRSVTDKGTVFSTFPAAEFAHERNGVEIVEATVWQGQPDLVHIFGTEGAHAYAAAQACLRLGVPFVVGLQGLSSTIAQHYLSGLPVAVSHGFTLRDAVRRDNVAMQAEKYRRRGRLEARTLEMARYVIGRTSWDRAISEQLNPGVRYFKVPETLRASFYVNQWSFAACQKDSIFVSQGHYPIKGLHFVLNALPMIVDRHPDTQVFVSGWPIRSSGARAWIKRGRYASYITQLLQRTAMEDRVHFVGVLEENQMLERYLRSHVFLSASTVENESNSVSEAKMLGVPIVASYVGGIVDRIEHGTTGFFYQHDAPYMLAHYISALFRDAELCKRLGAMARTSSLQLNDPVQNASLLRSAYVTILQDAHGRRRGE